jgi:mRNA interferase HigB
MRVISQRKLKEFWTAYPDAETALRHWYTATKSAAWKTLSDVRATFNTADQYKHLTVFDIGGNKYRLIASIHYKSKIVFTLAVLTHAEYDLGKWKKF